MCWLERSQKCKKKIKETDIYVVGMYKGFKY